MPKRIQRRRVKGWQMPAGAVYVGRGSKWGNPHRVGISLVREANGHYRQMSASDAVEAFRRDVPFWLQSGMLNVESLRGKDLACWCALDQPCHGDVLLEIANSH